MYYPYIFFKSGLNIANCKCQYSFIFLDFLKQMLACFFNCFVNIFGLINMVVVGILIKLFSHRAALYFGNLFSRAFLA